MSDKKAAGVVRPEVPDALSEEVAELMLERLRSRAQKHGPGAYAGPHEILGVLEEEFIELKLSITANTDSETAAELMDIAVGCIFGIASLIVTRRVRFEYVATENGPKAVWLGT